MALRIRLTRAGKKKSSFYRVVVADSRRPRDGAFVELVGHYSPGRSGSLSLDLERIEEWMRKGARPSNAVARLMVRAKAEIKDTVAEKTEEAEAGAEKEETDEGAD